MSGSGVSQCEARPELVLVFTLGTAVVGEIGILRQLQSVAQ
jgi:hypothetical protein